MHCERWWVAGWLSQASFLPFAHRLFPALIAHRSGLFILAPGPARVQGFKGSKGVLLRIRLGSTWVRGPWVLPRAQAWKPTTPCDLPPCFWLIPTILFNHSSFPNLPAFPGFPEVFWKDPDPWKERKWKVYRETRCSQMAPSFEDGRTFLTTSAATNAGPTCWIQMKRPDLLAGSPEGPFASHGHGSKFKSHPQRTSQSLLK